VKPISPEEHALRELAAAEAALDAGRPPAEVADRVAAAVRRFLGYGYGLPADRLTTAELLAMRDWPSEVKVVLETCDRAKFSGDEPTAIELVCIITRCRQVVGQS
jgi:hypothetical protein